MLQGHRVTLIEVNDTSKIWPQLMGYLEHVIVLD